MNLYESQLLHTIDQNINKVLAERGWKHCDLAERSHVTEAEISHILTEKRVPKISTLYAIASALNVSVDKLCKEEIDQEEYLSDVVDFLRENKDDLTRIQKIGIIDAVL